MSWADTETGNGSTDPRMASWRTGALKHGFNSAIALPVLPTGGVMACLTLYSAVRADCSEPERKLLEEFASDLAFGITTIRTRKLALIF